MPGDPTYSFPDVVKSDGSKYYADPSTKDLLGLAAKGNIILGDYTSGRFEDQVLPNLDDSDGSKTQAYAIDPTDSDIGYHTGNGGVMYDSQGRPLFDGNYDEEDGGTKLDGEERKFYESTLADADFQNLLKMPTSGTMDINAALFTNHALAGFVDAKVRINGSMVARDDGLVFSGSRLYMNHDIRLTGGNQVSQQIALPFSIQRPRLIRREECPSAGCP